MNLIVGLGNPGEKYASTRHNIGFMVVESAVKNLLPGEIKWENNSNFKSLILKKSDLVFMKPQTYMNASGMAVKKALDYYRIDTSNLWVVHDDIDLPLGKIRIKTGGASAGHHGIESIMRELGGQDGFVRFRLGVGRGKLEEKRHTDQDFKRHVMEKYVVSNFSTREEGEVRKLIKKAAQAVEIALHKGLDAAMNQYNK